MNTKKLISKIALLALISASAWAQPGQCGQNPYGYPGGGGYYNQYDSHSGNSGQWNSHNQNYGQSNYSGHGNSQGSWGNGYGNYDPHYNQNNGQYGTNNYHRDPGFLESTGHQINHALNPWQANREENSAHYHR